MFAFGDDLGPHKVIHVYEPEIGLRGILVVDNVAAGPSIGGLRMAPDVTAEECFRLARAMTLKNAMAGLAHGGGKSVLYGNPSMSREQKEPLIRAFASALASENDYIFGPDMGTNETCMGWVKDEIGRAVGLPRAIGGIPLDEIGATGWGLFNSIEVSLDYCGLKLDGARIVVQGFGAVGYHAARFLEAKGARLVATCDSKGAIENPNGIDVSLLQRFKESGQAISGYNKAAALPVDSLIDVECDIWIPAARPDAITMANVERLNTKIVAQGANIPVSHEAEKHLHAREILSLPDFVANAGGVICAAVEYHDGSQSTALNQIAETISQNTGEMLEIVTRDGTVPREAAYQIAEERVRSAMQTRRWSVF